MHPTYQNCRHEVEPENIFTRTKLKNTDSRYAPGEWTSAFRMQNHEKCHGISQGSRNGGIFENHQRATSMRTALSEMGHLQPPTLVATENTAANSIVNGTAKQKISRAIDMIFYWVRDII